MSVYSKEFFNNQTLINESILLYRTTFSISEVAKFTNLSSSFVYRWLKKINEYKPTCEKFSSICLSDSKFIIELYLSGIGCKVIADKLGYNEQSVRKLIKEMGILRNTKPYQNLLDHTWLDKIDSEIKSYYLGLLAADGWLDKNSLFIDLHEKDSVLLEKLQQRVAPFIPLAFYKKKGVETKHVRFVVTSKQWCEQCQNLKIGYNKSLTIPDMIDNIPKEFRNHFIRGYFDGDGTVGVYIHKKYNKKHARIQLLGTKEFLSGIHREINLPVGTISQNPKEKIFRLTYFGKQRLFEIHDYLYENATIFLERKKEKFVW